MSDIPGKTSLTPYRVRVFPNSGHQYFDIPLKELLPEHAVVGYVTDEGIEAQKKAKDFYLAQYMLSPRLLVRDKHLPYVIGGYYEIARPDRSASQDLILIRDFGYGIQLYRGKQR